MPIPAPDLIAKFEKKGYRPFIILFSWEFDDDATAVAKMSDLHQKLDRLDIQAGHGWYLTGMRTMIVVGWSNSNLTLQRLCATVTFGNGIQAEVCHAVDIHNLAAIMENDFGPPA
jgi:hypothetical protein